MCAPMCALMCTPSTAVLFKYNTSFGRFFLLYYEIVESYYSYVVTVISYLATLTFLINSPANDYPPSAHLEPHFATPRHLAARHIHTSGIVRLLHTPDVGRCRLLRTPCVGRRRLLHTPRRWVGRPWQDC